MLILQLTPYSELSTVGHGRSEGVRSAIDSYDEYWVDIVAHVQEKKKQLPKIKTFIFGHSMGGLLALIVSFTIFRTFTV